MLVEITGIEEVQGGDKYDLEVEKNNNFFANNVLVHNCRLLTFINSDDITFYSRVGNKFTTLGKLENVIKEANITKPLVLDGELCIMENGKENFKQSVSEIKRKNHTIENPKYMVFDILTLEEFANKSSETTLLERLERANLIEKLTSTPYFEILEQTPIKDQSHFEELVAHASKMEWEGLILRNLDAGYEGKRSKNLLKVKKFHDFEAVVEKIETGLIAHTIYIGSNGILHEKPSDYKKSDYETKTVNSEMLTNAIISYKGEKVSVGSGFSIRERILFADNPEKLIGKTITVQYFEESKNKDGKISLRFPTVKYIYDEKRDV